jgi:small conductance mechanosensitive channel
MTEPAPSIEILECNQWGTIIAVRAFCNNAHYWQVFLDTNKFINDAAASAKFAVPEQRVAMRSVT